MVTLCPSKSGSGASLTLHIICIVYHRYNQSGLLKMKLSDHFRNSECHLLITLEYTTQHTTYKSLALMLMQGIASVLCITATNVFVLKLKLADHSWESE